MIRLHFKPPFTQLYVYVARPIQVVCLCIKPFPANRNFFSITADIIKLLVLNSNTVISVLLHGRTETNHIKHREQKIVISKKEYKTTLISEIFRSISLNLMSNVKKINMYIRAIKSFDWSFLISLVSFSSIFLVRCLDTKIHHLIIKNSNLTADLQI